MRNITRGWIFDIYPEKQSMVIWVLDIDGKRLRLEDFFLPSFYVSGSKKTTPWLKDILLKEKSISGIKEVSLKEFWSNKEIEVIEVTVGDLFNYNSVVQKLISLTGIYNIFNCDIPLPQLYFYSRKTFPLAFCEIEYNTNGVLTGIRSLESPWDTSYSMPPLRIMEITPACNSRYLRQGETLSVYISISGNNYYIDGNNPYEFLRRLSNLILYYDPDLFLTKWGDHLIMPYVINLAHRFKFDLPLDREKAFRRPILKGKSYFSYGRVIYKAPDYPLLGRWHIDSKNSFIYKETGLEGIVEISRISKIPVQRTARTSPGTAISSMQMDTATQEGILIPWHKGEPEAFKTAWDLLIADKGGMIFQPIPGIHEKVAELDFSSMYPAIMALHNISPETILCPKCKKNIVPEIGYSICEERTGIVPKSVIPVLQKRKSYKDLMKNSEGREKVMYDLRQTALKWCLVTCFGYLGYKNARFGRIEAHEAVTAFGREKLLVAKEIAERHGFRVIHAIVDCLFVKKEDAEDFDYINLCREIETSTGIPINLEGIYRWICFPPSKTNTRLPVANRYFGVFSETRAKVRGLAVRRDDTPPFIAKTQADMIAVLARAGNIAEFEKSINSVLDLLKKFADELKYGKVKAQDLLITKTISMQPDEYCNDTLQALAAKQLQGSRINISPGQSVEYLMVNAKAKNKAERIRTAPLSEEIISYDKEKYMELLLKAAEEVVSCMGYDLSALQNYIT